METLQLRAAQLMVEDATGQVLTDIYSAIDRVAALPASTYLRAVRFRLLTIPVDAQVYTYLVQWVDATPPRLLSLERFDRHVADETELRILEAGEVVLFRAERVGEVWVVKNQ